MLMSFDFYNPTKILFGSGKLYELASEKLPGKKALFLMSGGKSARKSGAYGITVAQLEKAGVEFVEYARVMENPLKDMIMDGAAVAKENNCDFLLALGGGAVLDSAIAIAAMATNPGDLWDYVFGGTGKSRQLVNPGLPIVTITLTAGTASEINCWGVISNPETNEKIGFGFPSLIPKLAIVDPELMKTVPPLYTAYQGFDAFFHNEEVMISNGVNILSETLALSNIKSIARYLPCAVKDGNDIEAREHVAYGSTMAGMAMQLTSTTAQHSLEHAMSAYHHNLPHGAGLIMISRAFAEFFIERHACDEQFVKMARVMGMENADKPQDFIVALMKMQKECGVDNLKMSDYGIKPDEFAELARNARETNGSLFNANPLALTDADCVSIFEKSFK